MNVEAPNVPAAQVNVAKVVRTVDLVIAIIALSFTALAALGCIGQSMLSSMGSMTEFSHGFDDFLARFGRGLITYGAGIVFFISATVTIGALVRRRPAAHWALVFLVSEVGIGIIGYQLIHQALVNSVM